MEDATKRNAIKAVLALGAAAVVGGTSVKAAGADPDTDSVIVLATSGLQVIKRAENDWSLMIVSGNGRVSLTVVRYRGESAETDVQAVYAVLNNFFRILGLDV